MCVVWCGVGVGGGVLTCGTKVKLGFERAISTLVMFGAGPTLVTVPTGPLMGRK